MLKENEIAIGKISSAHGIRGEVKMVTLTDFPERFSVGNQVKVRISHTEYCDFVIETSRPHGLNFTIKFDKINDRNQAEKLKDCYAFVFEEEVMPLEDGGEYIFNLIGLKVLSQEGEDLGTITDVITGGANDVYVINDKICIPAIKDVILNVDKDNKILTIYKMPGLF